MDEEKEEKALMLAKSFANLFDKSQDWSAHDLAEDACLDWFGRTVFGRKHIISFLRTHAPKTHHTIHSVVRIPPIHHWALVRYKRSLNSTDNCSKLSTEECGQGDCKGITTPENTNHPNTEELLKAPCKNNFSYTSDFKQFQFLEIKGKVESEHTSHDGTTQMVEKNIQRIVLGYTDQIHLVVYEGKSSCRKKLVRLFKQLDE